MSFPGDLNIFNFSYKGLSIPTDVITHLWKAVGNNFKTPF